MPSHESFCPARAAVVRQPLLYCGVVDAELQLGAMPVQVAVHFIPEVGDGGIAEFNSNLKTSFSAK